MGSCFSSNEPASSLQTPAISSYQDTSLPLNPYMNKIHEITTEKEFKELINDAQNTNVLIVCDFYANWCPPCLQIAPTVSTWALNDYKTRAIFMKVDVDNNSDLSNTFSINLLPTFIFFKQGKDIDRFTGADLTKIKRQIDKLI